MLYFPACAREDHEIKRSGRLGKTVSCQNNGNYEPVQCLGTSCYCVDILTGENIGPEAHIVQLSSLQCAEPKSKNIIFASMIFQGFFTCVIGIAKASVIAVLVNILSYMDNH